MLSARRIPVEHCTKSQPKPLVALQMPFAAHGVAARAVLLRVQQHPRAPTRRLCAFPGVVLVQALFEIVRPADIGAAVTAETGPQHIYI